MNDRFIAPPGDEQRNWLLNKALAINNLNLPNDVKDAWWPDSMVVIKAVK